jgi:hypothetical protein
MITLTLSPNNEIRTRVSIKLPSKSKDKKYIPSQSIAPVVVDFLRSRGVEVSGGDALAALPLSLDSKINTDDADENPSLQETKIYVRRGGWGMPASKTSFGNNARRKMLRAGGALEHLGLGVGKSAFFTGTLPGGTEEAKKAIASYSGYISNRLTQWFRRYDIGFWGYVWEWQKRLALHIHLFAASEDVNRLQIMIDEFRDFWIKILDDVSALAGVDLFKRAEGGRWDRFKDMAVFRSRGEWVKKSVAGYLSKYVSKNIAIKCSQDKRFQIISADYYPARWWGMSADLKRSIADLTFSVSNELSYEQELEIALDIQDHLSSAAVAQHHYSDKYHPDNLTFISYIPGELWVDSQYLLSLISDIQSSKISAKLRAFTSSKNALKFIRDRSATQHFLSMMCDEYPDIQYTYPAFLEGQSLSVEEMTDIYTAACQYRALFP